LALVLAAVIPFVGGCDQSAKSAPVTDLNTNDTVATVATPSDTNSPSADATEQPDTADQQLEDAPGTIISTPATATAPSNNPQVGEVVKLAQAGVGDSILMAYVTNSPSAFKLSSDDIVYLNDLGVPQTVINAMLQRDQYFNASVAQVPAQNPATDQSGYVNVTPAPLPADQNTQAVADATAPGDIATPPLNPPDDVVDDAEQAPNGSYSYFYDSLSPYGNWINIGSYGPCWRPTTLAMNPGWQPYCDGGHWVYTDCGWCRVSDYSWGWAPFHYGRWFHSVRWGWCWAPDTVWGPAWVSWRYNGGYCGWAALPPAACYRPGFGFTYLGRSVGFNFTFGLSASSFVFVPLDHFHDRVLSHSRMAHREVDKIFRSTTLNNQLIRGPNNTLINRGVPIQQVAAASHTEIRAVHIRTDVETPAAPKLGRDGRSLSIYRPSLPAPRPMAKQTLAGEGVQRDANFSLQAHVDQAKARQVTREIPSTPERQPVISSPQTIPSRTVTRGTALENNNAPQPVYRSTPNRAQGEVQWPNYQHNQPAQSRPTVPADNNRQVVTPQQTAPRYSAPQQWQQRAPAQEPAVTAPHQNQFQEDQQEQVRQKQFQQEQARQEQVRQQQLQQNQARQEQVRQEQVRQQQFQQQEQVRQNQSRQEQFRQEQPRQEAAPRSYEQPHSYESHSPPPPAQSAPSRQDSSSGNNNNNGNGNSSGGGGRGR
jgi:hypothetical protein